MYKLRIQFHFHDVKDDVRHKRKIYAGLKKVLLRERPATESAVIDYIFCKDNYLIEINQKFLNHNDFTDIITFDLSESKEHLISEIYISIDRVKENALAHDVDYENELYRVISHGILHLCGFKDKTKAQSSQMRLMENKCIEEIMSFVG